MAVLIRLCHPQTRERYVGFVRTGLGMPCVMDLNGRSPSVKTPWGKDRRNLTLFSHRNQLQSQSPAR